MLLRTDDEVSRLRGYWLGPDASIRWPWDWTFPEWGVATTAATTTWVAAGLACWYVWGFLGAVQLEQLGLTLLVAVPAGAVAGSIARRQVAPIVNSDRRFTWLANGWITTTKHVWWANGPIDRAVTYGAGAPWLFLAPVAFTLPGPAVFWLGLSGFVCVQAARWVRDRVESDARYWDRTRARRVRWAGAVDTTVEVPIVLVVRDGVVARRPVTASDRARFLFDITRSAWKVWI